MDVISFDEALRISKKESDNAEVLLGNGFSMAWRSDVFGYSALLERADFNKLSPNAKRVFDSLDTKDFELVMRALRSSSDILEIYDNGSDTSKIMSKDADGLREILVQAIADSHPELPSDVSPESYQYCKAFLNNFSCIYTLNYDLLLYWTIMQNQLPPKFERKMDDGFRNPGVLQNQEVEYVTWQVTNSYKQNVFYLHGALHIVDSGANLKKFTWNKTNIKLIDQIQSTLQNNDFPLFVAEGKSEEKLAKIKHSDMLTAGYRRFSVAQDPLFIYGHSLAENDSHILNLIPESRVQYVFISLYGDPDSANNQIIVSRAEKMKDDRQLVKANKHWLNDLIIYYYDAVSARVWG